MMISLETLFIILIIDKHKGRYVTIFNVPGAYLNADITGDNFILLNIECEFVDIMCKMKPEHKNNLSVDNGVNVLYLQLLKYLYLCMDSELLYYDLYSNTLKSHGFAFNPYDVCIANSTINGKQCTISWYVDDNKVLHIDEEVNTKIIETISEHVG